MRWATMNFHSLSCEHWKALQPLQNLHQSIIHR